MAMVQLRPLRRSNFLLALAAAAFMLINISTTWHPSKEQYAQEDAGEWLLQSPNKGGLLQYGRRHLLSELPDPQTMHQIMPPLHMVQVGPPKTVTSYQFETVCVSLFLKLESLGPEQQSYQHPVLGPLNAKELLNRMECRFYKSRREFDPQTPVVLMTHNPFVIEKIFMNAKRANTIHDFWVFQTKSQDPAKQDKSKPRAKVAKKGYPNTMHILEVETFKEKGHDLIIEYAQIFGLDAARARELYDFIQTWSILKVCCGEQMSSSWRNELLPESSPSKRDATVFFPWDRQLQQQQPHVCSTYDIDEVERTLINMPLYQRLQSIGGGNGRLDEILHLSASDGEFTGTYCSRYNDSLRSESARL